MNNTQIESKFHKINLKKIMKMSLQLYRYQHTKLFYMFKGAKVFASTS